MDAKLKKLLDALYKKQDGDGLSQYEEGMKDILNVVLDKDEDGLDEQLEDYND